MKLNDDKLKNFWLEKALKLYLNEKDKVSELFSTLLVSEILIPIEFYLGGKEFNKEN